MKFQFLDMFAFEIDWKSVIGISIAVSTFFIFS